MQAGWLSKELWPQQQLEQLTWEALLVERAGRTRGASSRSRDESARSDAAEVRAQALGNVFAGGRGPN